MELSDFIHYYLGCEVFFDGKIWTLYQVNSKYAYLRRGKDSSDRVTVHLHEVIARLRQISDMTEEECTDVYTIERDRILHPPTHDHDIRRINDSWKIVRLDLIDTALFITDNAIIYKVTEDSGKPMIEFIRNLPEIFHYLISKHFDIFGLIPAGLAIDKTKLPQP